MRLGNALAFVVLVSRVQLFFAGENIRYRIQNHNDSVGDHCPLKLSSVQSTESGEPYSECVSVHVWMSTADFQTSNPKIEILSPIRKTIWPSKKCGKKGEKGNRRRKKCTIYNCIKVEAPNIVSVSFNTISRNCSCTYTVPDPVPEFHLSVEQWSKSINVTVEHGDKVYTRLCYQTNPEECTGLSNSSRIVIDPSQSPSAILNFPYLLPCLCVQVYYTRHDARRVTKCLFKNESLGALRDVWLSSKATPYQSSVEWSSECPPSYLRPSASLCWRQHAHTDKLCTPIFNSTLQEIDDRSNLKYNTSAVDKHPQMCVQFSLQGSHDIHCPFQSDKSSWEAHIGPGRQSVFVYLTSSVPAKFSAQLCVLNKRGCTASGRVHSMTMDGSTVEKQIYVPLCLTTEKPCVQVWQSDPVQHGKRILCPDYTHRRFGMFPVAALVFVAIVALLGILIHHVTKNGAAGWLSIQKPVLLVCSSEESAYVSAVCALASILQGELCATVRMALWAQSSPIQAGDGAGTGVADLGPLPWLYGQWEAVRKAQGKVLLIWSPEAKKTYEKWREDGAESNRKERKKEEDSKVEVRLEEELEEDWKVKGRKLGKFRKEKAAGKHDSGKLLDDENLQNEPSPVTGPVFIAALTCLQGLLQECKGHGVAFVYFQGLSHSRDIPKDFRGIPRYCLPQDFRGLIQELGGMTRGTENDTFGWRCWPRLVSKMLALWLARRLAHRLRTWLPQTQAQGKKIDVTLKSSQEDRMQSKLKLQLSASMTTPGTKQEQEPLHRLLRRGEELESQVSPN